MVYKPHLPLKTLLQCPFLWYFGGKGSKNTKIVVGSQVNAAASRDSNEHMSKQC